jgi:hypothetical protein
VETLYHEAKYSLSLLLQLFRVLKDMRITKDKDIHDLIELVSNSLPSLRNRREDLLSSNGGMELDKLGIKNAILSFFILYVLRE